MFKREKSTQSSSLLFTIFLIIFIINILYTFIFCFFQVIQPSSETNRAALAYLRMSACSPRSHSTSNVASAGLRSFEEDHMTHLAERQSEISMSPAQWASRCSRRGARNLNPITNQLAAAVPSFTWRYDLRENPLSHSVPDRSSGGRSQSGSRGINRAATNRYSSQKRRTEILPRIPEERSEPKRGNGREGERKKRAKQTCRDLPQV